MRVEKNHVGIALTRLVACRTAEHAGRFVPKDQVFVSDVSLSAFLVPLLFLTGILFARISLVTLSKPRTGGRPGSERGTCKCDHGSGSHLRRAECGG